jgi:hypothetical protein
VSQTANSGSGSRMLLMMARTGFLVAFLLGLGGHFGVYLYGGAVLWIHIVFGLLFLVPAWMLPASAGKPALAMWGAILATTGAALAAIGALWAPGLPVWPHVVLMIVAIGLVEMGSRRRRA